MTGQPLDLAGWLAALNFEPTEYYQVGTKPIGGAFTAQTYSATSIINIPIDRDVWVGPNPTESVTAGRPNAEQITRLAALHIDLDYKAGGCPTELIADQIVDTLSGMLGTRPSLYTESGHGRQPCWIIEDGQIDGRGHLGITRGYARSLLRRWGRLVATVAEQHGAKVDSTYDLTRVLRAPCGINWKNSTLPVAVQSFTDTGGPLTTDEIDDALNAHGVYETEGDTRDPGQIVSHPTAWSYAQTTCHYAATMARGWATDNPLARHPWMTGQATRIAAAMRNGCLDEAGHRLLSAQLVDRFYQLLAAGAVRDPYPGEISDQFQWGVQTAASMSDNHLASELGYHTHNDAPTGTDVDDPFGTGIPAGDMQGLPDVVSPDQATPTPTASSGEGPAQVDSPSIQTPQEKHAQYTLDLAVTAKAHELRVLAEARAAEQERVAGAITVPDFIDLDDFLAVEDEPIMYRFDGLWPIGTKIVWAAQFKAGKTTGVGNLIRSLADGAPFLNAFETIKPTGRIALIDDEMSEAQLRRWLRAQGIVNRKAVQLVSLRGRVATFDLINPTIRKQWVDKLKAMGCEVLVFDCLRPILDALGLSEDKEAGQFLTAFDALLYEANIGEAAVVHHMGHGAERSRGDSKLRDWPDIEWRQIRDTKPGEEDPNAPRYFTAFGRDVNVPEGLVTMDEETKHVTYDPEQTRKGNKAASKAARGPIDALPDTLAYLATVTDPPSGKALEAVMRKRGHTYAAIRDAIEIGKADGSILTESGPNRSLLHYLNPSHSGGATVVQQSNVAPVSVVQHGPYVVGPLHRPALHPNQQDQIDPDPFGINELFAGVR